MSIPFLFVILITLATLYLGIRATRGAKSAGDFFVANRSVGISLNAAAISGEYLSAASFMGVAGLIMKNGFDAMWYPVGYAAGYLFLLLFIAGPLRRFGAYTIPDFAQGRFDSPRFRKIAVIFVLCIGFFYTMPQMKGAGVTMSTILNWPYWVGIAVVGTVITFNVALGGMKGITLVQAFQYWAKLFAISVPFFVLVSVFGPRVAAPIGATPAPLPAAAGINVKGAAAAPNNVLTTSGASPLVAMFPKGAVVTASVVGAEPGHPPYGFGYPATPVTEPGSPLSVLPEPQMGTARIPWWRGSAAEGESVQIPPGVAIYVPPMIKTVNGQDQPVPVRLTFAEPAEAVLLKVDGAPAGVPNAPSDAAWLNPFGPLTSKYGNPLLYTFSLIIALVCGTAGLPHILVRFYTNPDGRAAKRTTLWVMVMLGAFYVFTPLWGTLGRVLMPALYAGNVTDAVVIKAPTILANSTLGQILSGVTSAGAFAAFMSTFSGLLVSMSGAFAHDIYGRILRPDASATSKLRAFKVAAVVVGAVSMALGLLVESFDIAMMVGWAFAIGAASYFPLLLLGSWWRGLTKYGAASGMLLGGVLSVGAIVLSMLVDKKVIPNFASPTVRTLMEQPAIWAVPLSVVTMVVVSRITQRAIPADADMKMLRLHAPEELGYSKNYVN